MFRADPNYIKEGSRTIASEQNCPKTLILTLTLTQALTLTEGQFSSGAIVGTPLRKCKFIGKPFNDKKYRISCGNKSHLKDTLKAFDDFNKK